MCFFCFKELWSYRHDFCVPVLCIKHVLLLGGGEKKKKSINNRSAQSEALLVRSAEGTVAAHHVVGVLSGVGEEVFVSVHELLLLLLLLLQLLQLLELPASLGALQLLLDAKKKKRNTRSSKKRCNEIYVLRTENDSWVDFIASGNKYRNSVSYLKSRFVITDMEVLQVMQGVSFNWCELLMSRFKYLYGQ